MTDKERERNTQMDRQRKRKKDIKTGKEKELTGQTFWQKYSIERSKIKRNGMLLKFISMALRLPLKNILPSSDYFRSKRREASIKFRRL
jgi:hypothetical protein